MARRKRSRSSRALRQANLTSQIRFLPENEALAGLLRDENVNYKVGVRQEHGIAQGITQGLREATPRVVADYTRALDASRDNTHYATSKLAGLGSSADDIRAALVAESARAHDRISESGASTLKEYAGRLVDTKAGEAFAIRNLGNVRLGNIGKIQAKRASLARQQGMFTQAQYETFLDKLDQAGLDHAKARETARHNRQTEATAQQNANTSTRNSQKKPGGGKGGGGGPTRTQRVAAREKYEKAVVFAKALKGVTAKNEVKFAEAIAAENIPLPIARAAVQTRLYGGVGPNTRRTIARRYGVHLPGFPKRRATRRPARRPSAIPGVNLVR